MKYKLNLLLLCCLLCPILFHSCKKENIDQPGSEVVFPPIDTVLCNLVVTIQQEPDTPSTMTTLIANPTDGEVPFTFLWSEGSTDSFIDVMEGLFEVTVTDAEGCTAVASEEVIANDPCESFSLTITAVQDTVSVDYFLTANTSGGTLPYAYEWSNDSTTAVVLVPGTGTYSVTATDAEGCSTEDSYQF